MSYMHDLVSRAGEWVSGHFRLSFDSEAPAGAETESIEFFGGPFDGMRCQIERGVVFALPPAIEIPFAAKLGTSQEIDFSSSSQSSMEGASGCVALYDLVPRGVSWEYRFGGMVKGASIR